MRQAKKKARKPLILLGLRAIEFWEALTKKIPNYKMTILIFEFTEKRKIEKDFLSKLKGRNLESIFKFQIPTSIQDFIILDSPVRFALPQHTIR